MSDRPTEYNLHKLSNPATQQPSHYTCISQPKTFPHYIPTTPSPPHVGNLPTPQCSGSRRIRSGVGIHFRNKWTAHCFPIHLCLLIMRPQNHAKLCKLLRVFHLVSSYGNLYLQYLPYTDTFYTQIVAIHPKRSFAAPPPHRFCLPHICTYSSY